MPCHRPVRRSRLDLATLAAAALWLATTGAAWGQQTKAGAAPKPPAPGASATQKAQEAKSEAAPPAREPDQDADIKTAYERFQQGDLVAALDALEKARAARPTLPPPKLMLARLLLNVNDVGLARALLEDVAAEEPEYPATYALFGSIALSEGRLSDAQLNYTAARDAAPRAAGLSDVEREDVLSQAISGLAAVAERRQDWNAARARLEELVGRRPEDGLALQRLGRALFWLDHPDDALERLNEAVRVNPALDPPRITLGWLLADRGRFDDALAAMRQAVREDPESPATHLGLGTFLLQRERANEALPEVETALEQAPEALPTRQLLGAIAHRLGDYRRAEELLSSVLEAAPEDVSTINLLALTLADRDAGEDSKKAVELAEENIRRAGQNPQTLSTLGWAYYRDGRVDDALQVLQAATSSGQASADTAYYLACVLAETGETDDAIQLLRSSIDAPIGQFTARDAARKRLAEIEAKQSGDAKTDKP